MGKRLRPLTHKAFLLMKEIWKDVVGYEGLYKVSSNGNIYSLYSNRNLSLSKDGRGYYQINLSKDKVIKNKKIHQLVAIAFLNHTPNGYVLVVDHIDNNPLNNRLDNLQLISNRYNCIKDKANGSSKYTGVYYEKKRNKYVCEIKVNNKRVYHKRFNCETLAYLKYIQQADLFIK